MIHRAFARSSGCLSQNPNVDESSKHMNIKDFRFPSDYALATLLAASVSTMAWRPLAGSQFD